MGSKNRFELAIGLALLLIGVQVSAPASAKAYRNSEYQFDIDVPAGTKVCHATRMTHRHGFFYNIDTRSRCRDDDANLRSISIWADYNASFATSLKEFGPCARSIRDLRLLNHFHNRFRDARTCVSKNGKEVDVKVELLAGRISEDWGEEKGKPAFFYSIQLSTRPNRMGRDLVEFRKFISTIKLHPAPWGS